MGNSLIAKVDNTTTNYVHTDHLGSVVAESNSAGQITKRFHYKPFGETLETQQDDIGYTGHKHDLDLGLTYMQARYYDPVLGRFYGNDPVGYVSKNPVHSFNRYAYANNNSYKYVDPDGRFAVALLFLPEIIVAAKATLFVGSAAVVAAAAAEAVDTSTDSDAPSTQEGTKDVGGFIEDMKGRSEPDPNSRKSKVRTITDGTTVEEAFENFPGEKGEASDGSPIKTATDGSTAHIHSSSTDNGKKTLTIKTPESNKPIKFREPEVKSD